MTTSGRSDDDLLLAALGEALDANRPSDALLAAGKEAFDWRDADGELARLTYDSLLDSGAVLARRAAGSSARSLSFDSPTLTLEVEVGPSHVAGQVVPSQAAQVVLQTTAHDDRETAVDADGYFTIARGAHGPSAGDELVRIRCSTATGTVVTDWVRI
ncbi:hypothetical protein [Cellulomonas chitinilytica]|nr:hypothetical protein [Cellulomonas chitinilytica]